MKNVQLVDIIRETEEDVEFGTCELCMNVGDLDTEKLLFRDAKGKELEFELGYWSWGDYYQPYNIDNVGNFAHFINQKQIQTLDEIKESFDKLYHEYQKSSR